MILLSFRKMKQKITDRIPGAVRITSRTNPLVISLSKLVQTKHRREQGLFLAEGVKLSEEASSTDAVRYVLVQDEDGYADEAVLDVAARCPDPSRVITLPESVFSKITTENAPQGIITVMAHMESLHRDFPTEASALPEGRVLAVDCVRDPGNLGTVIRTAHAFGYRTVVAGGCADIYHPRTVRAAMGALFHTRILVCSDLAQALVALRESGHRILSAALAQDALELGRCELQPRDCVVIGNAGHGVSDAMLSLSDGVVRIPMCEGSESLNAAGAAAVLMWEYYRTFGA